MAAALIRMPAAARVAEWTLRFGLGGLLIYAGAMKALDTEQFAFDVQHYELTSWTVSLLFAVYLPWLEIFTGAALVVRWRLYAGAIVIAGMLAAAFLLAISSAWWRGLDITCGCFGREENATNFPQHIALNAGMLLGSIALGWLAARQSKAVGR